MSGYLDVKKLFVTIHCSDQKTIYYYKSNLYAYSKLFRNFVVDTGTSESLIIPFKSNKVSIVFKMIDYVCGNYKGTIKCNKLERFLELVDMIDYFDLVKKEKFYDIMCNSINKDRFLIFKDTHDKVYHDIKPCLKFLFDS